jgi:hypothetical protein
LTFERQEGHIVADPICKGDPQSGPISVARKWGRLLPFFQEHPVFLEGLVSAGQTTRACLNVDLHIAPAGTDIDRASR